MLQGKSAIVTGSTSGIGFGVAQAFAAQGANVLLNGFGDKAQIERLVADLNAQYKVNVAYSGADMGIWSTSSLIRRRVSTPGLFWKTG